MTAPARMAALQALRVVAGGRADLPAALARSRTQLTDERDRALAAEIVIGTLRWQRALDHLIEQVARRPLSQLQPEVVLILRLSLYQLLHLQRVPAAAVVDDAVTMTRAVRRAAAAGFVNAVLRNVLRQRHRLPLPPRPADAGDRAAALAYLGITHSHPEWLVARWLDRHGFERTEQWVAFNNETPKLTVRANRLRTTRDGLRATLAAEGIETECTRFAPDGLVITAGHPLRRPPDGLVVVQDEASQIVPLVMDARPGERVLDLCASPGGKTTALAAAMQDRGIVVATDVRSRRMGLLREAVRRSGARHVHVLQVGAEGPLPFRDGSFDRVLVDAPCSGLGTIRRDPDIRWRRQPDDLAAFARAQVALLARAGPLVRPGGRLVYATCSSEPDENEAVVHAFARTGAWQPVDLRARVPAAIVDLIDRDGMLRTRPDAHRLEAFFAAALERH
jgi:16S rRNA (cytosine967-C5)-methyltransferase